MSGEIKDSDCAILLGFPLVVDMQPRPHLGPAPECHIPVVVTLASGHQA